MRDQPGDAGRAFRGRATGSHPPARVRGDVHRAGLGQQRGGAGRQCARRRGNGRAVRHIAAPRRRPARPWPSGCQLSLRRQRRRADRPAGYAGARQRPVAACHQRCALPRARPSPAAGRDDGDPPQDHGGARRAPAARQCGTAPEKPAGDGAPVRSLAPRHRRRESRGRCLRLQPGRTEIRISRRDLSRWHEPAGLSGKRDMERRKTPLSQWLARWCEENAGTRTGADRQAGPCPLLPYHQGYRGFRPLGRSADPVPGARQRGELRRVLLPGDH